MSSIPKFLETGTSGYVYSKEQGLIQLPERLHLSQLMCISFTPHNLFLSKTPAL